MDSIAPLSNAVQPENALNICEGLFIASSIKAGPSVGFYKPGWQIFLKATVGKVSPAKDGLGKLSLSSGGSQES